MQQKFFLKRLLIIFGIVIFLSIFFYFIPRGLTKEKLIELPKNIVKILIPEEVNIGLPKRLKIPVINVDAAVEYVGVTIGGAMDVPKGPDNVAWYKFGSRPGEVGSAVIAGHYGWKDGIPAIFDNLDKLKKGDKLYSVDEKGLVTTFVVRELRIYSQYDDASNVFSSNDGKIHLNLITCKGVWNKAKKSYSQRLVVFTDKEIN